MKMSRYFRGDFRDKADGEFVASRSLTVSGVSYETGEPFDKSSVSSRTLRLLYENRKIAAADSVSDGQNGTVERDKPAEATRDAKSEDKSPSAANYDDIQRERVGTVVEGKAGWFHVESETGEKVGKATRDEAEAAQIKEAYERGEKIPD